MNEHGESNDEENLRADKCNEKKNQGTTATERRAMTPDKPD
jgi:hypothetical protein